MGPGWIPRAGSRRMRFAETRRAGLRSGRRLRGLGASDRRARRFVGCDPNVRGARSGDRFAPRPFLKMSPSLTTSAPPLQGVAPAPPGPHRLDPAPTRRASLGQAFAELEPHRDSLLRFLERRCGSRHDAEDVVQEALLRAVRYRSTPRWPARIEPWLRTIAANVLTDRRRRSHRRREVSEIEDELFELCSPDPGPSDGIDDDEEVWLGGRPYGKQWLLGLVRGVLADSSEMDREVLLAYYSAGGGNCNVISERLGVQAGVVKVRLYRARRRLRQRCWERLFGKRERPQGEALSAGIRGRGGRRPGSREERAREKGVAA